MIGFAMLFLFAVVPGSGNGAEFSDGAPPSVCWTRPNVAEVIKRIGPKAEARVRPYFEQAGIPYPSRRLAFVVLKKERKLEVWAKNSGDWVHVRTYDVLAASGIQGPKRKKGDRQVPEGLYRIAGLNPASRYHLSMKLNYPNNYDLQMARDENRSNLGGDIYIHGKAQSLGCIAIGDTAIEELFVMVAKTGPRKVKVIIAPNDLRKDEPILDMPFQPSWLPDLYETIGRELAKFRLKEDSPGIAVSGDSSKIQMAANPQAIDRKEPPVINQARIQDGENRQDSGEGKDQGPKPETIRLQ